jgi:hypothetical protein
VVDSSEEAEKRGKSLIATGTSLLEDVLCIGTTGSLQLNNRLPSASWKGLLLRVNVCYWDGEPRYLSRTRLDSVGAIGYI